MKVGMYNAGACGISQTFFVGTVNKNTDATKGTKLQVKLPAGFRLIDILIDVKTAFASGTTLDISGDQKEPVKYVDAAKMDAVDFLEKDGKYASIGDGDVALTAKLSTAETGEGSADIYAKVVRLEV
ncbi:hypothetical protein [Parablautia sp. Marseille-Q6255]|uniref:hypothetical protein n=1 Tax=Parablautia sp. Marseille-Q6255 TaxID=3039593 RepID=UPI0024BCE67A|nr:hypothetical protein [Parablautia sp. Marseille-Q6255]